MQPNFEDDLNSDFYSNVHTHTCDVKLDFYNLHFMYKISIKCRNILNWCLKRAGQVRIETVRLSNDDCEIYLRAAGVGRNLRYKHGRVQRERSQPHKNYCYKRFFRKNATKFYVNLRNLKPSAKLFPGYVFDAALSLAKQ